ncbi:MAG TPA: hypothetical protein VNX68_19425 [Nitrosopumilaceae archaeon]|nr:hypothetical protein [Nitrosopumilaceae archaeon]
MDRQDGGGGNSIIHYRIHVLNPETGEENIRFYAGTNAKLLDEQNNILLYKNDRDNFHLFDLTKNSPAQSYTKESLSAQFPELSSGIDKIQYENDDQPYSGSILSITSKTGKNYFFNPFSSKLTDSVSIQKKDQLNSDPPDKYEIKLRNSENKVIEINLVNSPNSSVLWRLEAINNEQKQKDNESKEFINACFIAAYPDLGIILIKSFETTDENNFLITAISPDMKKLWQISQKQMEESDYDSKHKNTASITFKSNLILNAYHFYFSLNAQTGKVNWKKSI